MLQDGRGAASPTAAQPAPCMLLKQSWLQLHKQDIGGPTTCISFCTTSIPRTSGMAALSHVACKANWWHLNQIEQHGILAKVLSDKQALSQQRLPHIGRQ